MGSQLSQLQIMDACLEFLSFTRRAERLTFDLLWGRNSIFAMTVLTVPEQLILRPARKRVLGGTIWYCLLVTDEGTRYCANLAVPRTILATSIISLVSIIVRWKQYRGKTDDTLSPARLVSMVQYRS
jgi:hypothetical protein